MQSRTSIVPAIVLNGPEWFASIGSGDVSRSPWEGNSGTKVFSLLGNVRNSGIVEVPMGTTLRPPGRIPTPPASLRCGAAVGFDPTCHLP